jgi:glucose/arabinose dehydrogenase
VRGRGALAALLLALSLGGCATFPDNGPRAWQEQLQGAGELGDIPRVPQDVPPSAAPQEQGGDPSAPTQPDPCDDPDPAVIATCLDPVGAIAVLPDGASALVAERETGRVLRVVQGVEPELVTTVPVDAAGGITGLVLSPAYTEDRLVYAYVTTPEDNRVVLLAPGEAPKPVLTGIPRGATDNGGALAVDVDGALLVATGAAGRGDDPASLAGKLLRIDTRGRPAEGNPDPASPVLSSGLTAPGGICVDPVTGAAWITDRTPAADLLHLVTPGPLLEAAWRWPDRPGVGGCAAVGDAVAVPQADAAAMFLLRVDGNAAITSTETALQDAYGRLGAATVGPDGLIWFGTLNKDGGDPVPSDDRVVRIPLAGGGGASRA